MKRTKTKYTMWQNVWYVLKLTWQLRKRLLILCALAILAALLLPVVTMYLPRTVLAELETMVPIHMLVLTVLGFTAALVILNSINNWTDTMIECYGLEIRMRRNYAANGKAFSCDYAYYDTAEFMAGREKANNATINGVAAFAMIYPCMVKLCTGALGFLTYFAILLQLGWWIAPVTALCAASTSVIRLWGNQKRSNGRDQWWVFNKKIAYINTQAMDTAAAKDIRLFGISDWFRDVFQAQLKLFADWDKGMERGLLLADLMDCILTILREGIAYFVLIRMVLSQSIMVSDFVLYFAAVSGFSTWISDVFSQFTELHRYCLDIDDYRRHVEHPDVFLHGTGVDATQYMDAPCEIRLEQVSYQYPGSDQYAIHHLTLTILPGEKIAVVGLNGAGKTTLVKLICGLLDPTDGRVLLNGVDVREFDRDSYYKLFSVVFQDFCILPLSVAENVAQGIVDEDRVRSCLNQAGLLQKADSLPLGIESRMVREVYEDAVQFSGGELQRLMLARAIYKQAPAVLLDEPTAALDPIAEDQMYQRYSELTKGRTSVYISHRLASTRFCDRVLFLEHGEIIEEGNHNTLMASKGKYYELFELQSQYYRDEHKEDAI